VGTFGQDFHFQDVVRHHQLIRGRGDLGPLDELLVETAEDGTDSAAMAMTTGDGDGGARRWRSAGARGRRRGDQLARVGTRATLRDLEPRRGIFFSLRWNEAQGMVAVVRGCGGSADVLVKGKGRGN